MANEMKPRDTSASTSWIGIVAGLAAAAVLFGIGSGGEVEVFGLEMSILLVGLVLWFLGFIGGMFSRRRRG
jgi:hypothetical protein